MRRLGALTLMLLTVFVILVDMTRFLGKPSAVPTVLQPWPGCTVGCWNGINVGITTMGEAETILRESHFPVSFNAGWSGLTWAESSGTITRGFIYSAYDNSGQMRDEVGVINLNLNDESLRLGDAILLWGTPIATFTHFCVYPGHGYFTIFFEGDVQITADPSKQINHVTLSPSALTPNTVVTQISYVSKENSPFPPELQSWKGFVQFPPNYLLSDYCG